MLLSRRLPAWLSAAAVLALTFAGITIPTTTAYAAGGTSAVFSGGEGAFKATNGTRYAKQGAALT